MTRELPPFLRHLLASPPRAGEGVHNWLFRVARQLHAHLPAVEIFALLKAVAANCGRYVSDSEIWDAIRNSLAYAWQPSCQGKAPTPKPRWPTVNREQRAAIIRDGGGLSYLLEISPVRIEDNKRHAENTIDSIFPGNPLLCVGDPFKLSGGGFSQTFNTKPREEWRGELSRHSFIDPSPMCALLGRKKSPEPGKNPWSAHTLDNTGPRRFLVCEFDTGNIAEHASLLIHLAGYAPLVCAVHSGGKSLHGWFFVADQPEDKVLRFFKYAVSLGADRATWTRSQFVRVPDGTRDNGKRQAVFFLNLRPLDIKR